MEVETRKLPDDHRYQGRRPMKRIFRRPLEMRLTMSRRFPHLRETPESHLWQAAGGGGNAEAVPEGSTVARISTRKSAPAAEAAAGLTVGRYLLAGTMSSKGAVLDEIATANLTFWVAGYGKDPL